VAEAAYHNGTSSNEILFKLVLRLRKLLGTSCRCQDPCDSLHWHANDCTGNRWSLVGDLTEGVMEGLAMAEFVPIHMGAATVVGDPLVDWLRSWAGAEAHPLEATEGFTMGQDLGKGGKPNADGVLIRHLCVESCTSWSQGRCGRIATHSAQAPKVHSCICLSLSDVLFMAPPIVEGSGSCFSCTCWCWNFWPASCHELLIIGVCLPFIIERPWKLQGTPKVLGMGRKLHHMLADGEGDPRVVLQELLELPRKVEGLRPSVVCRVLQFQ